MHVRSGSAASVSKSVHPTANLLMAVQVQLVAKLDTMQALQEEKVGCPLMLCNAGGWAPLAHAIAGPPCRFADSPRSAAAC